MLLHTINKQRALEQCAQVIKTGDSVVLLEDGVYLLLTPEVLNKDGVKWFAVAADVARRGLQEHLPASIKMIDYRQFVAATVAAEKLCHWC